jgi:hypothetical protein
MSAAIDEYGERKKKKKKIDLKNVRLRLVHTSEDSGKEGTADHMGDRIVRRTSRFGGLGLQAELFDLKRVITAAAAEW